MTARRQKHHHQTRGRACRPFLLGAALFLSGCGSLFDEAQDRFDASIEKGIDAAETRGRALIAEAGSQAQDTSNYILGGVVVAAGAIFGLYYRARARAAIAEGGLAVVTRAVEDAGSDIVKRGVEARLERDPKRSRIEAAIRRLKKG